MLYGEMPEVTIEETGETVRGFKFTVPHPKKMAVLRLPTTEEMSAYHDAWKRIQARKKDDEEVASFKPDLDLFHKLRVGGDDGFDEFEARFAIVKLTEVSVKSCERIDDEFEIVLATPFGETKHRMEIPTARQLFKTVYAGKSAARLYEQTVKGTEGYLKGSNSVPLHHQGAAGAALADKVGAIYEGAFNPNP